MKRPDGSLCSTSAENAAVFHQHFQQLYNRSVILDLTVLDLFPQNDIVQGYDDLPADYEIKTTTLKLKNTAPGDSGICLQIWKSLLENATTEQYLREIIQLIWITENIPEEWAFNNFT